MYNIESNALIFSKFVYFQRCILKGTGRLVTGMLAVPENPSLEQLGGFEAVVILEAVAI